VSEGKVLLVDDDDKFKKEPNTYARKSSEEKGRVGIRNAMLQSGGIRGSAQIPGRATQDKNSYEKPRRGSGRGELCVTRWG